MSVLTISPKICTFCHRCKGTISLDDPIIHHSELGWLHADCFGGNTCDYGGQDVWPSKRLRKLVAARNPAVLASLATVERDSILWWIDDPAFWQRDGNHQLLAA